MFAVMPLQLLESAQARGDTFGRDPLEHFIGDILLCRHPTKANAVATSTVIVAMTLLSRSRSLAFSNSIPGTRGATCTTQQVIYQNFLSVAIL
jgi:hypothetical protein